MCAESACGRGELLLYAGGWAAHFYGRVSDADGEVRTVAKKKRRRRKKRSNIGTHIALILLIALFAGGALYYAYNYQKWVGRFLPNTTVNGIDYSGMTAEEAEARFRQTYAGRKLEIEEMDGKVETIAYDDIDYHFTTGDTWTQLIEYQDYML